MTCSRYEMTVSEWSIVEPLLPNKPRGVDCVDNRRVFNGFLWRFPKYIFMRSAGRWLGAHMPWS